MITEIALFALALSNGGQITVDQPIVAALNSSSPVIVTQEDEVPQDKKKPKRKRAGDKKKGEKKGEKRGEKKKGGERSGERREALKKQFDADGDGKLNEAEKAALKKHLEEQRKGNDKKGKKGEKGQRGKRGKRGKKKETNTPKRKGGVV